MKILMIFITALMILSFGSVAAFAEDLWSETPGLENLKTPSFINEPSRLSNKPPAVDMWAETPALKSDTDTIDFYNGKVVVKSGLANPELYVETPDLETVTSANKNRRSPDHVIVAEQNKKEINKPLEIENN